MELRQVNYFIAVAEELHFGRAASRVGIAQPALSQQIIQLERELGGKLLIRTKRSVKLTEAGQLFLDEVKVLAAQSDHAIQTVKRALSGESGTLAVGFVESTVWDILPQVIRAYRACYPEVDVNLHTLNSSAQIRALQDGSLSVGIVGVPLDQPELQFHVIREESVRIALPIDHRLADKPEIAMSDLEGEPFISTTRETGTAYYDAMIHICMKAGISPHIIQTAVNMVTVLSLVSSGMGIAMVHESAVHLRNDIAYRPIQGVNEPVYRISLAWRKRDISPILQGFLNVILPMYPLSDIHKSRGDIVRT
ncbi:LysR family transcriptional regulator [Paenibacillus sp. SI8]|uniref:LysR family transcriptional regulator n=1 Tax=unclassified Paenibacillus TaxID=185978 RepID=UPI0034659D19